MTSRSAVSRGIGLAEALRLVEQIHQAGWDASGWPAVIDRIAASMNANATVLFDRDPSNGAVRLSHRCGVHDSDWRAYENHYARIDVRMEPAFRLPPGTAITDTSGLDSAAYRSSVIYNEFYAPLGAQHMAAAVVNRRPDCDAMISFMRGGHAGVFDDTESEFLQLLLGHIGRALRTHEMLLQVRGARSGILGALEQNRMAAVLLGAGARIIDRTTLAGALLDAKDPRNPIRCSAGILHVRERAGHAWLHSRLTAPADLEAAESVWRIRTASLAPWELRIHRIPEPLRALLDLGGPIESRSVALLTIHDAAAGMRDADALAVLYGVTRSEARCAALLAAGRSSASIAAELGVSLHTVRTHLKRAMQKIGVHTQSQLVHRVLTGVAPREG